MELIPIKVGIDSFSKVVDTLDPTQKVRILISIFSPKCSGRYLFKLVEWLDFNNVNEVEIQISDTLQRHNLIWQQQLSSDAAYISAFDFGDNWIRENSGSIDYCLKNFEMTHISRWDYWIRQPRFLEKLEILESIYKDDEVFKTLIEEEIVKYFERVGRTVRQERVALSKKFLKEEIAVDMMIAEDNSSIDIYPGPVFSPTKYLMDNHPNSTGLVDYNYVNVGFELT